MSNNQTQLKRQAIIKKSPALLKTWSKYSLLLLSGLIIHQAQAFPILIGGDASKDTLANVQNPPKQNIKDNKPTTIKLTDNQRKQKIYDLNVMYFSRDEKSIKSIDIENLKITYWREVNSCDSTNCTDKQTTCSDIFTRSKKTDSVEVTLPKGLLPLYFDKRVCQTTDYIR